MNNKLIWRWFSEWVSRPGVTPVAMRMASVLDKFILKLSGGRYRFSFVIPVLLLKCRGVISGKLREVPLLYVPHNGKYYVLGSHGALPAEPAWCANLRATPKVNWLARGLSLDGIACEIKGLERESVWLKALEIYPGYSNYAKRLSREIPIFELSPETQIN